MIENFGLEKNEEFLSLESILSGPGMEKLYKEKFGKKLLDKISQKQKIIIQNDIIFNKVFIVF